MNATRWRQIDELFGAAADLPEEQRAAFLAARCAGDEQLKIEVLSLLAAQAKTEKFMENSAINWLAQAIADDAPRAASPLIGQTVGRYRIERLLGAGGMGEVYLAFDPALNRRFALKILPAEFVAQADRIERFRREAQAVSALNHPNIVTIYDVGRVENLHFIATEYIEGKTVRQLIDEGASLRETLSIVQQTAEALAAAHQSGIVHRDIKPENIMVRPDGYVKILDFGLAKLVGNADSSPENVAAQKTQKGMVMGTPAYMSPEQAIGETVDHRTDIWSLGVVFYELLTGKKPFPAGDQKLGFNRISAHAAPVSSFDGSLPPALDAILDKFLEKDRELRYQTASDLRADLKRLKRELDSGASASAARGEPLETRSARRRNFPVSVVAAAACVLLAACAAAVYYFQSAPAASQDWKNARNIPLTDQTGTERYPSLTPDGETFVFAAESNGNFDILRRRVGGKTVNNLTLDSRADDSQPAFSPDGKFIAFRSEREPKGIYVMEETGENPRRVCDFGYFPAWSPDSREIVVATGNFELLTTRNPSDLYVVNVATGAKRLLVSSSATQPAWSPNGRRIAFWLNQTGSGRRDVATIAADGGEPVVVTDSGTTNWNPVWSPDGRFLYFASDRAGSMAFWRVRVDEETGAVGGPAEMISTPAKFNHHLSFSRDGKRMIYVQTHNQSNIKAVRFDAKTEKVTGEPYWITRRDQTVIRPELSPDGKFYVMRLSKLAQEDLAVVGSDGRTWRDLTDDEFFDRFPRWSPDGRRLAFSSDRSGKYEIWLIDADGGAPRQLTFDSSAAASLPVWSPDGRRLIYDVNHQTYVLNLTAQEAGAAAAKPELLPSSEAYKHSLVWDWSPDGDKLFGLFVLADGKTYHGYYSFTTGRSEPIGVEKIGVTPLWLADSRRLVYAHENKIYLTDIETKKNASCSRSPRRTKSPASASTAKIICFILRFQLPNPTSGCSTPRKINDFLGARPHYISPHATTAIYLTEVSSAQSFKL